jgi:hypothetical protein
MKATNPLAPLERIIAAIGGVMIFALLVVVPSTLLGGGSAWGFGEEYVCVDASLGDVASHSGSDGRAHLTNLAAGVNANASQFNLCSSTPSTGQRVLVTLVDLPEFLFALGFIVITWRLTRRVRRRGLFIPEVAKTIGRLGVYLFVGEIVVLLIQGVATQRLVSTMLTSHARDDLLGYAYLNVSWPVIIAAFGLQAMGRVMAMTVPMREEIDATV